MLQSKQRLAEKCRVIWDVDFYEGGRVTGFIRGSDELIRAAAQQGRAHGFDDTYPVTVKYSSAGRATIASPSL